LSRSEFDVFDIPIECLEVRIKIWVLFTNFTPARIDRTKVEINGHLKVCPECREYFKAEWARKQKELKK
jgi:hypothetical protein